MRFIYLIIGFFITGLGYYWGCFTLVAYNAFSFCCLLLVFQEVPSVSKIGCIIPSSIKHMQLIFARLSLLPVNVRKKIIVSIYILMGISIYFAPLLPVKIGLGALTIFITYYLFKVIPDKEQLKQQLFPLIKTKVYSQQYDIINLK